MGYMHVREYPGGKADWTEAGLPMEQPSGRERAAAIRRPLPRSGQRKNPDKE
jgi:hypothetical protein